MTLFNAYLQLEGVSAGIISSVVVVVMMWFSSLEFVTMVCFSSFVVLIILGFPSTAVPTTSLPSSREGTAFEIFAVAAVAVPPVVLFPRGTSPPPFCPVELTRSVEVVSG